MNRRQLKAMKPVAYHKREHVAHADAALQVLAVGGDGQQQLPAEADSLLRLRRDERPGDHELLGRRDALLELRCVCVCVCV